MRTTSFAVICYGAFEVLAINTGPEMVPTCPSVIPYRVSEV